MKPFMAVLIVATGLAGPAWAQAAPNSTGANTGSNAGNQSASPQAASPQVASKVRQDLTQAGFTDVQVMPTELLVHAKNKDGQPVLMWIGPNTLTELVGSGNTTGSTDTTHGTGGKAH